MLRRSAVALAAVCLVGVVALASPAAAVTRTFTVEMTGTEEGFPPGDPNGFGIARITVNTDRDLICYALWVRNVEPTFAAHIHVLPTGAVVVPLKPPTNGTSSGCIVDSDADAIAARPGQYYVNVHNAPYPGGAVTGRLA